MATGNRRCQNPLCGTWIWEDQYRYGDGRYCSEDCSVEARLFSINLRRIEKSKKRYV